MFTTDVLDFPLTGYQQTAPEHPGRLATDSYGNIFQLCLLKGASVAVEKGGPALWYSNDSTGYTVTPDWSQAGQEGSNSGCGMFMAAVPASAVTAGVTYTWVLRRGNAGTAGVSTIRTETNVAAGQVLFPYSLDGKWAGRDTAALEPTSTTATVNRIHVGYTRVADTDSHIRSPAFVEINGFNWGG